MSYIFKRALGIALVLYVATFVAGVLSGLITGQDMSSFDNIPASFWYIGMVVAVVLTALFSMWYFKNTALIASAKAGFLFGLTTIVVSSLIDFVLFSLGNASGANVDLTNYYGDFRFWIIVALVVLTATIVGAKKNSKAIPSASV